MQKDGRADNQLEPKLAKVGKYTSIKMVRKRRAVALRPEVTYVKTAWRVSILLLNVLLSVISLWRFNIKGKRCVEVLIMFHMFVDWQISVLNKNLSTFTRGAGSVHNAALVIVTTPLRCAQRHVAARTRRYICQHAST